MQFLKRNYEKIILGLVLLGLGAAVAFLPFVIQGDRQAQEDRRTKTITRTPKELEPPALNRFETLIQKVTAPVSWDFVGTNKLFNPDRWQKSPDGRLVRLRKDDVPKIEITSMRPLYFIVTLDRIEKFENETRYGITVDHQAQRNGRRGPIFVSQIDRKKEYPIADRKETLTLTQVQGEPENPTLALEIGEGQRITVSTNQPWKEAEGYVADLRYVPDNRTFRNCRTGTTITFGGNDYKIVAITQNEVVLSAKPNDKKYTIRYNAAAGEK